MINELSKENRKIISIRNILFLLCALICVQSKLVFGAKICSKFVYCLPVHEDKTHIFILSYVF